MRKLFMSLSSVLLLAGCGEEAPTFSILADGDTFYQSTSNLNNKLDILFVIDNSGSMAEEQANLAANFNAFINDFISNGYDFHIGVTVTDAWRAPFVGTPSLAKFRDGNPTHSGVFIITPTTPNIVNTFNLNAHEGTNGNADERAFQSFTTALNSSLNSGFRRADAYLAVIIVSDEDDFSWSGGTTLNHNYNSPNIHTVQSYVDWLDVYTQSTGALRRYGVSTITVSTQACLNAQASGIMGTRYMQLANLTDGVIGDICSPSFGNDLDMIQQHIAELSTQFFLSREPVPASIVVRVNGAVVPQSATNGWTYNAQAISIIFHGNAIPPQGAGINVNFDPANPL